MLFIPTKHISSPYLPELSPWVFVLGKWVESENTPLKLQQCEKSKGKVHPVTGQEGPEGQQRYSTTLSLTSAIDGVSVQRHGPAALLPEKTRHPLHRRLGGPHGRSGRLRKISPPVGFDPQAVQAVVSHYTDCAIPAKFHQYRPDNIQGKAKDVQIHETCKVTDIAPKFLNIGSEHPRGLYPRVGSAVPRFVAQKVSRFCRF